MAHTYSLTTHEIEAGGLWILGQPGLHSNTLFLKPQTQNKTNQNKNSQWMDTVHGLSNK